MKNQNLFFLISSIIISLSVISLVLSTSIKRDILDTKRKENFLSIKEIRGMLERVIEEKDSELAVNYKHFYKSPTPQSFIRYYLSDAEKKKQINNAIRLLCAGDFDISSFDLWVLTEQTILYSDQEIVKSAFYNFREIYLLWLSSKAIEMIYSEESITFPYICDWLNEKQPSSFFLENETNFLGITIKEIRNNYLENHVDLLYEDRTLLQFGFKLTTSLKTHNEKSIKSSSNKTTPTNKLYSLLLNDSNFLLDQEVEIDFLKLHQNFAYNFSKLDISIRPKLTINPLKSNTMLFTNTENKNTNTKSSDFGGKVNLKHLYTEMKISTLIYENMLTLSLKSLRNSFSNLFNINFYIDGIFSDLTYLKNYQDSSQQSTSKVEGEKVENITENTTTSLWFIDKNIDDIKKDFVYTELAFSFDEIFGGRNVLTSKLYQELKKLPKRLFKDKDIIKKINRNVQFQEIISSKNNLYNIETHLNKHCSQEYAKFVYLEDTKRKSQIYNLLKYEDDKVSIMNDFHYLCYYNKAMSELNLIVEKNILESTLNINLVDLFISKEFNKNLLFSEFFRGSGTEDYYTTIEKITPSFHNNDFFNEKNCAKLNLEEIGMMSLSLINRVSHKLKYYIWFEVITSSYNKKIDNAKFYLTNFILEISTDIRLLDQYLNNCNIGNQNSTLVEKAYDYISESKGLTEEEKDYLVSKIDKIKEKFALFYDLFMLVDHTVSINKMKIDDKIDKVRNVFYAFYYEDSVNKPHSEDFSDKKKIFTKFELNSRFILQLEEFFKEVVVLVFRTSDYKSLLETNVAEQKIKLNDKDDQRLESQDL